MKPIPFNRPCSVPDTTKYIQDTITNQSFTGDGPFNKKCENFLEKTFKTKKSFLTPSCTASLEMATLLIDLKPNDEVILPSYTFTSTANAFLLRGAKLVFADINEKSLSMCPKSLEKLITKKTKVICPVHYAGGSIDIDSIVKIAKQTNKYIIEDAAQAIGSSFQDRKLGSLGDIGALSFHETKNIHCGEGGAILINNPSLVERAFIIKDKGTNRQAFLNGSVDKYTWNDVGSSYSLSELSAAFLLRQLEDESLVTKRRKDIFSNYWDSFTSSEKTKNISLLPEEYKSTGNGHIFSIIFPDESIRNNYIKYMKENNVSVTFHYIPLHNSPYGKNVSKRTTLPVTESVFNRIARLPIYYNLSKKEEEYIIEKTLNFLNRI